MFEMRAITKRFAAVVALGGASLQVEPGEIRALLGSNGSGKSTMVKVLSGLVKPDSGEILFDGKPIEIHNAHDSRKYGIAVAYQDLSLIPSMTVVDNLVLGLEPCGPLGVVNRKLAKEQVMVLLERLKIECDPDELVQNLKPSTQSMVEVAKALATKPRLLLLDEVTASLHHDEVDTLFGVLNELKEEGVATVIVTHRMSEIYRICDNCTILKTGETVAQGKMSEMDLDEVVFHMTGKRPETNTHDPAEHEGQKRGETLLEIKNLVIKPKVKGISMQACKGEIIGIGGLEGQGQSEYLRALLGVEKFQEGQIQYDGKIVKFKGPSEAIASEMGFISGDRNRESIYPIRSVEENIYAGKATKGPLFGLLMPKEIRGFARDAVEKYAIKIGALKDPANSLSGGNQQKLVVGRWIALSPKLLLLDDPTKGVDIGARREIQKILKSCTEQGMTVIIVSSDNEELLDISDRIYIFYEGKVSAELAGANRTEEKLVAAMMGLTMQKPDTKAEVPSP